MLCSCGLHLCDGEHEGSQLLVVLEACAALWAILALHLLECWEGSAHELQHDGRVDVGDDTQAEQAHLQASSSATRRMASWEEEARTYVLGRRSKDIRVVC
jgi:hypothetical protein